jgi:hypothetical protein
LVRPTPLALRDFLIRFITRLACLAAIPATLAAQATQTVPANDPVYALVDRLVAARLVDSVIMGQRSMSRREIGRILGRAQARSGNSAWIASTLREYRASFPDSVERDAITSIVTADATALESPARGITPDGNGVIDVRVNPLAENQLGRPIADGGTFSYRAAIGAGITPWLAAAVSERTTWIEPRGGPSAHDARIEQLYGRALWRNVSTLVGRDYLFFGQGVFAGLTSSVNARAIDQVRVASDRPFLFPWLFRYVGPTQATLAVGDLGKDQFFPHTRFVAYKVSSRPHPRFEVGTSFSEQVGGQGAPGGTLLQKVEDAIPILDGVVLHRRTLFSNKFVGVDMRYTVPGLEGTQFYAEGVFDDFDLRRVRSVFTEDAGYVWGLSSSCLVECGKLRASVEYHVTGVRFYTHGDFRSGYTVDRMIIGDPLGPRARGAYGMLDVLGGHGSLGLDFAYEDRSGNLYGSTTTTTDDSDFRFVIIGRNPAERRWRATSSAVLGSRSDRLAYTLRTGAERVENFGHVKGWRTNWLLQGGIQLRPTLPFFQ